MPPTPNWLARIAQIVQQLTVLECPVVDRAVCERLFGVKRRRAIELMQQFGGYRSGNTILLDRVGLLQKIRELETSPEAIREFERKQRISDKLDELHRLQAAKRVKIRTTGRAPMTLAHLDPDVSLKPGMLAISFQAPEDLFSKLFELSQVAANDCNVFSMARRHVFSCCGRSIGQRTRKDITTAGFANCIGAGVPPATSCCDKNTKLARRCSSAGPAQRSPSI